MRIALCQLNLRVGDLAQNKKKILETLTFVENEKVELALFPELAICSYPVEDLLLKAGFVQECTDTLNEIAAHSKTCISLLGCPQTGAVDTLLEKAPVSLEARWPGLFNSVSILQNGKILNTVQKSHLPNYAVFDERRYFAEGVPAEPILVGESKVGIAICEDLWVEAEAVENLKRANVDFVAHLSASPYYAGKQSSRLENLTRRVKEFGCPILAVNLVGGQDELVFDGGSMVVSAKGEVLARAPQFQEDILIVDLEPQSKIKKSKTNKVTPLLSSDEEIYEALVLGTRDYVQKNGFKEVLVGMSGGIDSSLVTTIAVDALGSENVHGILMPSRFSSDHSVEDAKALANNLKVNYQIIEIEKAHSAFLEILKANLKENSEEGSTEDLSKQNLQARIRGNLLMALSNINGWLVLTTSNKSEMAVGYSTLYGDTAGAYAVIKDLWKMEVYRLAEMRNNKSKDLIIPENVFTKPPSAELKDDQRDDQNLPPYEILDPILKALVEDDLTPLEVIKSGQDPDLVKSLAHLLAISEYKRRQAPPGVRISSKAFGKDRRLPITNSYF